jgi:hypothetical protein
MERAAAIASVMRHQALQKETMARMAPPGYKPLFPQLVALALSTVVAVYVWFGSPGWLGPSPVPPVSLEVEEDFVRSAVILQVERINSYQEQNGRLPAFLEEAGPPLPGVEYRRLDSRTYRIRGRGMQVEVDYNLGDALDEYWAALDEVFGSAVVR